MPRFTRSIARAVARTTAAPAHGIRQRLAAVAVLLTLASARAYAAGPAMPWDGPLNNLLDNLSGPTARVLVLLAIVGTGLMWAFTRNEEGMKKVGQIAFGGSIAMGAVTMAASLGLTSGATL